MTKSSTLKAAACLGLGAMLSCSAAYALVAPTVSAPAAGSGQHSEYTMNIGHVAGSEHPINIALKQFKEKVEQRTGGKVAVNVYDSGSLGGELEMLEQMNLGTPGVFGNHDRFFLGAL